MRSCGKREPPHLPCLWIPGADLVQENETVAEILDSIWTGQVITFILPVPTIFSQGSQRCLDRVNTCQTPPRALSTSRTSQYPNWDCIAETISTPPVHDVAISPLATPRTSAPCTTWAI